MASLGENQKIIDDLNDVLRSLREMMRCDVLDEAFHNETIIGLTHEELRAHSHNPMKSVSYTHLDVYKRQELSRMESTNLFTTASRAGPLHSSASGSSIQRPPET